MTTNKYQEKVTNLPWKSMLEQVVYMPKLMHLGTGQGDWKPVPYAKSTRDVLKISLDSAQLQSGSISDNVFRQIGITHATETINIQPIRVEMVESGFSTQNISEAIPMVITELNKVWDKMNAEKLKTSAKLGGGIATQTCVAAFVNEIIRIVAEHPYDIKKHVIIPQKAFVALSSISGHDEKINWLEELKNRLNSLNATLRFSLFLDDILVIQEPLLAEYQGEIPQIYKSGLDERSNEYWVQFMMSNSDFKPRIPEALIAYALDLDLAKISDYTCPEKKK